MKKIAFFDAKPYDKASFDNVNTGYEMIYIESKLNYRTAVMAKGCEAVCAFVNDDIDRRTVDTLCDGGTKIIAMRSAGYSNIDPKAAQGRIKIVRVPAYSPYAVAEHAMALLLSLNRKIHRAYIRVRDFNFNIAGFTGFDLHGKTAGVIGTGKIGRAFIDICHGFGMDVLAYDPYPAKDIDFIYTDLDTLYANSDVISLHCPLTDNNRRMLDKSAFSKMKNDVFIINTSRGALIDSTALLDALNSGKIRGAGLDVYEEETPNVFEDRSDEILEHSTTARLLSFPNVMITSHQGFFTEEALRAIAETTLQNALDFEAGKETPNIVRA